MPSIALFDGKEVKDEKKMNKKMALKDFEETEAALTEKSSEKKKSKKKESSKKRKESEIEEEEERSETSSELGEPVNLKSEKEKKKKKKAKAEAEAGVEEQERGESEHPNAVSRFRISVPLREKLKSKGIESLFPIQAMTFDMVLDGSDLVGRARTGQV